MKPNAEIVCRRNKGYGLVCDWKGPRNGIAKIYREDILSLDRNSHARKITGNVYNVGRLKLRVVEFPVFQTAGAYRDVAHVMLESPHAELFWLYRQTAERIVKFIMRCEVAVQAFQLRFRDGEMLPVTSQVADWLL